MKTALSLVHPLKKPNDLRVTFECELAGKFLVATFAVSGSPGLFIDPQCPLDRSVWGLWERDVVELFLSSAPSEAYYEFQVSPLNQYFELEIFEPRRRFNKDFVSGFEHEAMIEQRGSWQAQLRIPLERLQWDGRPESLRGNAFAILGASPRTYWALSLPSQEVPDFHRPEWFCPLISRARPKE